jgi:CHAD domain-containing protein
MKKGRIPMSFELKPDQSIRKGLKRLAKKQMDGALECLTGASESSRDEVVHDARRSMKKIRALLRFVRPKIGNGTYSRENACFRDAARPLTEVRDAKILIESLDTLIEHFRDHVSERSFQDVRHELQSNLQKVRRRILDEQNAFCTAAEIVRSSRDRIKDWSDVGDHWSSLGKGLEDVYRQARDAFAKATDSGTVENLHEWRKQSKYLHYQLRVLRPIWPERIKELENESDQIGNLLGDNHDLAMLRKTLAEDSSKFGDPQDREMLTALIDRRRSELEEKAKLLGERFFGEKPKQFAKQLHAYWNTWQGLKQQESAQITSS